VTEISPLFKSTKRLHNTRPRPVPFSPAVPLKLTVSFGSNNDSIFVRRLETFLSIIDTVTEILLNGTLQ
jgi:hypothetical protein